MAVVDKYVDTNLEAGKLTTALHEQGTKTFTVTATVAVAAADDDTSVYRCFTNVPSSCAPIMIAVHNTAVTAGDDYDLGLYKTNGGVVVDADILADGLDMSSARLISVMNNVGMTTIDISNGDQDLATLGAETNPESAYDIALTANTVGSVAGTIRVTGVFAYL